VPPRHVPDPEPKKDTSCSTWRIWRKGLSTPRRRSKGRP
jgi:hypothetical protein